MNSPRRTSKPYQVKSLPQLTGQLPLLLKYSLDERTTKKVDDTEKRLHVDLSRVEEVDVIGAVTFAANLAKVINKFPNFSFQILFPEDAHAKQILHEINYESLLIHLGMRPAMEQDLWGTTNLYSDSRLVWSATCRGGQETLLFIPHVESGHRESVLKEIRRVLQDFYSTNPSNIINYGQLHQILHEIIKNTIDHSCKPGVLGLKRDSYPDGRDKCSFVLCELGEGVSLNVRSFLSQSSDQSVAKFGKKGGYSDFLHWAFKPGNTSKPHSGVNAGLGLSTITAAARGEQIRLYLSDAMSITYITDISELSHLQIRKTTRHSHHIPCFMYFGHTT